MRSYANDVASECFPPYISITAGVWTVPAAADLPVILGIGVLRSCFSPIPGPNTSAVAILGVAPNVAAPASGYGSVCCDNKSERKDDCKYGTAQKRCLGHGHLLLLVILERCFRA